LASNGSIGFDANSEWGERVPKEKQALFLANAFAHNASYLVGFFGGLGLAASTWISRRKAPRQPNETQIST
jgi:hypothetical protein